MDVRVLGTVPLQQLGYVDGSRGHDHADGESAPYHAGRGADQTAVAGRGLPWKT